eukprot:scaffold76439_cov48-Phaeocystis_antarctica.AAC.2
MLAPRFPPAWSRCGRVAHQKKHRKKAVFTCIPAQHQHQPTGNIAAGGLAHRVAPHLQHDKQVDCKLSTISRGRAVAAERTACTRSRSAISQTRAWHRERARPTTSRVSFQRASAGQRSAAQREAGQGRFEHVDKCGSL